MSPHPALDPWLSRLQSLREVTDELRREVAPGLHQDLDRIASATQLLGDRLLGLATLDRAELKVSRVRHDLRTPLNHVLGYGEMLREDTASTPAAANVKRLLGIARQILEGLDELVETVLTGGRRTPLPPVARELRPTAVVRDSASGNILVVDDNEGNAELLRRLLERMGHEVTVADDARWALELLAHRQKSGRPFDLVLLDILMPGMDGMEMLRVLKRDPDLSYVPVVMVSSLSDLQGVARCIELGAADYLPKPFEPVLLRARVTACLDARRMREREVAQLNRIEQERQRASALLRVILPDAVVEELERTDEVKPRRYEDVAVLFCDIVGFTRYCDTREPEEVLPHLQRVVVAWEQAAARHRLQKIKTVGDGFMAAAGLLIPVDDPVRRCVECAVDLLHEVEVLDIAWSVRVGIHTGPVVAGVLGHRQFQFDLWGDTVNTAARVEQHGVVGGITLSATAWERLSRSGAARGRDLGKVAAKGKGELALVQFLGFDDSP